MIIILADLGCLRAFRVVPNENNLIDQHPMLQEIEVEALPKIPSRISDTVSDQAGRFQRDGSPGMARGDAHGLAQEQEKRSLGELAGAINGLVKSEGAEMWALAAPKSINTRLVSMLESSVGGRLTQNLLADLCKLPVLEIQKRFKLPTLDTP